MKNCVLSLTRRHSYMQRKYVTDITRNLVLASEKCHISYLSHNSHLFWSWNTTSKCQPTIAIIKSLSDFFFKTWYCSLYYIFHFHLLRYHSIWFCSGQEAKKLSSVPDVSLVCGFATETPWCSERPTLHAIGTYNPHYELILHLVWSQENKSVLVLVSSGSVTQSLSTSFVFAFFFFNWKVLVSGDVL